MCIRDSYYDFKVLVDKQEHGKLGQRLNKEKNGFNSITKKLFRQVKRKKIDESISIKEQVMKVHKLSLIHISEPTRQAEISYAVFCLKKKNMENLVKD